MKNYLDKIRAVTLTCPFCGKPIQTKILAKARVECPACKTDLIVSTKMKINFLVAFLGFVVIILTMESLGLSNQSMLIKLPIMIVGVLVVGFIIIKLCIFILKPNKVYAVDFEDPTIINRKK